MKLGLKESGYKSLLKESKSGQYAPTFRQKVTISEETGRSGCKFFGESKGRLSDTEVRDLSWRDLEFSCMSRISSLYVNGPNWGLLCSPEAIKCRQTADCPFADSDGKLTGKKIPRAAPRAVPLGFPTTVIGATLARLCSGATLARLL